MDNLFFGLYVAIIGIGIVFMILLFLGFCITLLQKTINALMSQKKPQAFIQSKEENYAPPEVFVSKEDDDFEIIAVISAALAAYAASHNTQYRITNIRRAAPTLTPVWQASGRQQLISERSAYYT